MCLEASAGTSSKKKERRMHLNIQIDVVMYFDSISYLKLNAPVERGFMAPLISEATGGPSAAS